MNWAASNGLVDLWIFRGGFTEDRTGFLCEGLTGWEQGIELILLISVWNEIWS